MQEQRFFIIALVQFRNHHQKTGQTTDILGNKSYHTTNRDVTAGVTGATAVAPKFSDALTLFQPGGRFCPTIAEVAP